jgi:hypothetical protein
MAGMCQRGRAKLTLAKRNVITQQRNNEANLSSVIKGNSKEAMMFDTGRSMRVRSTHGRV